jgi:hypothetical protein
MARSNSANTPHIWNPVPSLDTADAVVDVLSRDVPVHALGHGSQLLELIVWRLLARRDPGIDGNVLAHAAKGIPKTTIFWTGSASEARC